MTAASSSFLLAFGQGLLLSLGLIVAIGAQNAFVLRQGLLRQHVLAVATACALSDILLIAAGVAGLIEFSVCDFADTEIPPDVPGIFYVNPEYGERLGDVRELELTYSRIGDFMKQNCRGYYGYVFTGNLELAKKIGLKAKRRIEFYTSTIDCRLLEYELYSGTRDQPKP